MNIDNILLNIVFFIISLLSAKYLLPIMPDAKKAKLLLKNFLIIFFRYVFNIAIIAWTFFNDDLDKFFIFKIVFFSFILIINYTNDMRRRAEDNVYNNLTKMFESTSKKNRIEIEK